MSTRRLLLLTLCALLAVLVLSSTLSAADTPKKEDTTQKAPPPSVAATRDAFLAFALEKAKTYTDVAEVAVSKAVDTVGKEAPLAMAEFLTWRAWMHGMKVALPLLGFGVFLSLFLYHWPRFEFDGWVHTLERGGLPNVIGGYTGIVGGAVTGAVFLVSGLSHLFSFIQICVAPRVYLIEQVMVLFR